MKLRHYETFYLLHPDLNDEEREEMSEKFQKIITDDNGRIVKVDPWPLRKLAYKVQKQVQGYYIVLEYAAPGSTILELTRKMRLDERLLKFVTVKKSDTFDPAILERADKEAAEAKAAAEAEAAAAGAEETGSSEKEISDRAGEAAATDEKAAKE